MGTLQWFALSLLFLFSGMMSDALATFLGARARGIEREAPGWAFNVMKDRGVRAILYEMSIKLFAQKLFVALLLWMLVSALFGWSYGALVASFFPICTGIVHFLGVLSWLIGGVSYTFYTLTRLLLLVAFVGSFPWGIALCILGRDVGGLIGKFLTPF